MIRISGSAFAYCTVNIVTADLDEQYASATTCASKRPGSVTTPNEPRPLATLTMTGCLEAFSSGSMAWVTRTMPNTLVS